MKRPVCCIAHGATVQISKHILAVTITLPCWFIRLKKAIAPFENWMVFICKNLSSLQPRMLKCQFWLKLAQWLWKRWKYEKCTDRRMTASWAFSPSVLKQGTLIFIVFFNPWNVWWYNYNFVQACSLNGTGFSYEQYSGGGGPLPPTPPGNRNIFKATHIYQGRIQDLVLGGTKFGKVIWEYYYYSLLCLWNVWCRKIKMDLQVIMIIWGEETEPLSSHALFSFFSIYFFMFIWDFLVFMGGERPLRPPLNPQLLDSPSYGHSQPLISTR